ncbi:MAG: aminopeptidase [Gammaproteobacteria bacterium]|nr:aminopeptidase [Gammaproteobacteria bacterium]
MRLRLLFVPLSLAGILALSSCSTLGYYSQAVGGHLDIMLRARPLERVIDDEREPASVRAKLRIAREARRFAAEQLDLPLNRSYESYVDLGRPSVTWNVTATSALSVEPVEWCYPIAGCFNYRGYFSRAEAEQYAEGLRRRGFDVYVFGASAYSTLGWFDDPLLSTMVKRPEAELVATLFHELAHQKVYVHGDSAFNEAFAVAVAEEGVRRWFHGSEQYTQYLRAQERLRSVSALLLSTRERLAALYGQALPDAEKLAGKRTILDGLRNDYQLLKAGWDGYDRFDSWLPDDLNNAHLALTATYQELVPGFKAMLAFEHGHLERFYESVRALAALSRQERRLRLRAVVATADAD